MRRQRHIRLLSILVVAALLLAVMGGGQALAQGTPPVPVLPQSFWGSVKDASGNPILSGTVEVWMNGVKQDSIAIVNGQYGGPGGFDERLIVRGTSEDVGKTIEFCVNGVKANETAKYAPGEKTRVDLTVAVPSDTVPPTVEDTDPVNGAANIPVNATITVTFTEDVQEGPQYAGISLVDEQSKPVTLQKSISGKVLTLKPASDLDYYKRYTVTIPVGAVKDLAGNELAQTYVFSFTTAAQQGAKVEITVPQSGVLDNFTVPPGASSAVLNQSGAQLEIPQGAFSGAARITFKPVDKTGLPGAGSIGQVFEVKIENVTLSQPVTLRLPAPAGERVRVFKLVGDRWVNLGGKLNNGYVEVSLQSFSTFTAANAPAPPTASPAPGTYTGSVQVTLSAESGATILYGLNAAPQNTYTAPITLTSSATIRAVAVKDALTSEEMSFAYTVTSSSGGGGGSSGGGGGGGGGAVIPYVSNTDPADKATGVPVDKEIKLLFNETVTAGDDFAKITLKDASGNAVEVNVRIDGNALYIKPKAALAYGATYTVVIPAKAVKDSSGRNLSRDYIFSFTTAKEQQEPPEEQPKLKFKDMAGHWAEATVAKLAGMGVISGYPDGTFRPDNEISRAEVTAILVRALKLAPGSEQDLKFKDNASIPAWARGVVAAAAREGLVRGYPQPDGTVTFEPDRPVSRAEMAALAVRILEKKVGPVAPAELKFADTGSIPQWARSSVGAAVAKGIVVGYPDNTFRPDKQVTRAEAAAMILRLLEAVGSK
ncbi:S-layer domain protein [Ammonifex degensii KC4]|uniref:S-layer domain protein n=1 Tax=Ammonifex degensii (strain DSM 10501 / KC4) TaxID=429009 RepID=C9RAL8_AMMDK|nr:Ig-like domain-containing protein [Ammonifex degensii]ACX51295.1 S-layer domain protein [Ammonifex degensii KC4]